MFYVNTIKEGRILKSRTLLACMIRIEHDQSTVATHDSFDEVACAANKDVGQAAESVERGKKLVGGLRRAVSNCTHSTGKAESLTLRPSLHSPLLETR